MADAITVPHVFGVRHLSPGGAYHLLKYLDEIKPEIVLIEGPSNASDLIKDITKEGVLPPIAILAYTESLPIRTLVYPFAKYSPEYQAMVWAKKNNIKAEFIDLPTDVFIGIEAVKQKREVTLKESEEVAEKPERYENLYKKCARLAGEKDYDAFWERNFEQNLNKDSYRKAIYEFSRNMRELSENRERNDFEDDYAENIVRESYMRKKIGDAIKSGISPDKIVVVTGAYHASKLSIPYDLKDSTEMTEKEVKTLPEIKSKLTLMPYSYYKLSSYSGYGAGNNAPQYYELVWDCLVKKDQEKVAANYFSKIVSYMRNKGTFRSSAEVIESVRLANSLASLKGSTFPVLNDLKDAAITCLGQGYGSVISEACAFVEIGTSIGVLPEGISQTPVQDDFNREIKKLKLDKYKTPVASDLELDLRENRRVKSEEAAYLDLNRSFFLNRLNILKISFATKKRGKQADATWAENWILYWTPESEIQLVEALIKGETIELATGFALREELVNCDSIKKAAEVVREACECGLVAVMEQARAELQRLSVDNSDFIAIAETARELSLIISFGSIRKFDTAHFIPLLTELFMRAVLLMKSASYCDEETSKGIISAINILSRIAVDNSTIVDIELWDSRLYELSDRDDINSKISGFATAVLLERNLIDDEKLSQEVSRRLSPGIPADIGSGWFEGLAMKNRNALLYKESLWKELDDYIQALDDEMFKRALVFLRRTFGNFAPDEKRAVAELLGKLWKTDSEEVSAVMFQELNEEEKEKLDSLNEFDFDDL